MNAVSLDMREKLDMIKGYWPDEVGNPTIMKLNPDMMPVMVTAMDSDKLSNTELSESVSYTHLPNIPHSHNHSRSESSSDHLKSHPDKKHNS